MAQLQRNAVIVQTLYDITFQSSGIGHQLRHHLHPGALQCHTPGHNKADVSGSQDNHFPSGHKALHVHQTLGRACAVNASGPVARYVKRPPGTLPASHGQNDRPGLYLKQPLFPVHGRDHLVMADIHDHGV